MIISSAFTVATATNPAPHPRVRPGVEVQRAAGFVAAQIDALSRIGPVAVLPTGCEDDPEDVAGWEAVIHLADLHRRARGMLGRTRRTSDVPGSCSTCAGVLYRDEPSYEADPCPVYCGTCHTTWTYDEYERYVGLMLALPAKQPA